MAFLLIPQEVTTTTANVWVALINQGLNPNITSLRYNNKEIPLDKNWITFRTQSNKNSIHYQHITLQNLQPRTAYSMELLVGNTSWAVGRFRTLPDRLPLINERPFNVLLASCFACSNKESSWLGGSFMKLQSHQPSDIKILCGDQVYLDDPSDYFLRNTHSYNDLEDLLFANYLRAWSQKGVLSGFQYFLQTEANYFSSDDHEFWNNAPNAATLIRDSWSGDGRKNWLEIANNLLGVFQTKATRTQFSVGSVSFFIADTRINRDADRSRFMSGPDLAELSKWIDNLNGIGVLVVGQPIFSEKAGFFGGRFGDWSLPNYEQYEDLVRILMKSNHSVIVLTGDVHYGRIAVCQIKPNVSIYEIISSPTALVNPLVGGSWEKAPDSFPISSIPGTVKRRVLNKMDYQAAKNHFLTLGFSQYGSKTKLTCTVCEIVANGQSPVPKEVGSFLLN